MSDEDEPVDTGLVAAAVTLAASEPPPVPVVVTPPPPITKTEMPKGWDLHRVAAFVGDIAQNMYDLPYILKKHELTEAQYAILKNNEFYKRALEAEILTWTGANTIQKRLALEAAIAMEAAMPTVAARLTKSTEPLSDITMLFKALSEIAGTSGAKAAQVQQQGGEKFKIIINLGADTVEREATRTMEVRAISEGEGNIPSLPLLPQGS